LFTDFRIIQNGLPDYSEGTFGLFRGDFRIIKKGIPDYSEVTSELFRLTSGLFRGTSRLFRRDFQIIQKRLPDYSDAFVFDMIYFGIYIKEQSNHKQF